MELTTENTDRIKSVVRIHAKLQRAIHAGSKKLFLAFKDPIHMIANGLVMNEIDPENPDVTTLLFSQVSSLHKQSVGVSIELAMSVSRDPENSGAKFRFSDNGKTSTYGSSAFEIVCALTTEGKEQWKVSVTGWQATLIEGLDGSRQDKVEKETTELEALDTVKSIAKHIGERF